MTSAVEEKGTFARLIVALREVWVYSLTGIAIGFGFVLGGAALEHDLGPEGLAAGPSLASTLLEHVGMGFIVAAIAVVFYEWGAHIKQSLKLSAELKSIRDAVAENALASVLRANVRGESIEFDKQVVKDLESVILNLKALQSRGDWAQHGYARFVGHLLRNAAENAERLCQASTQLRENPRAAAEYHILALSPSQIADALLSEQMSRLPAGGRYVIVSNPRSWCGGQLEKLHAESRKAVHERNVGIRRIFVLAHEGAHRSGDSLSAARRVIEQHFRDASTWSGDPGYAMKLMTAAERDRLRGLPHNAADFIFRDHFGVFDKSGEKHLLQITAAEPDLSELKIGGLPSDSKHLQRFEVVWKELPDTTAERMEEILRAWESEAVVSSPS